MTAAQERRLLLAALDYAAADRDVQIWRQALWRDRFSNPAPLVASLKARRASKARLLRAVGGERAQPILPLHRARVRMEVER